MFVLCSRRAQEKRQTTVCVCTDEQRMFEGVYVTEELKLAVTHGYKIIEIFEVHHYSNTLLYTVDEFTGGKCEIFRDYVDAYLQIKMENSGLPPGCKSELDLDNYIKDYYENEGNILDKDSIQLNSSRRSIAKMMLVSLFGKLAQKCHI